MQCYLMRRYLKSHFHFEDWDMTGIVDKGLNQEKVQIYWVSMLNVDPIEK